MKNETSKLIIENIANKNGIPTGGIVQGLGLSIKWQDGALKEDGVTMGANGTTLEIVIDAAIQRLAFFQKSKFKCRENALAITKLQEALHWLNERTTERKARGVEGTYKV